MNNPGTPDALTRSRQQAASGKLAASARWALLVRLRVAADAVGVMLMLSGRAALGAAFLLAAHSAFWSQGAAARVDACANPSPLSPIPSTPQLNRNTSDDSAARSSFEEAASPPPAPTSAQRRKSLQEQLFAEGSSSQKLRSTQV